MTPPSPPASRTSAATRTRSPCGACCTARCGRRWPRDRSCGRPSWTCRKKTHPPAAWSSSSAPPTPSPCTRRARAIPAASGTRCATCRGSSAKRSSEKKRWKTPTLAKLSPRRRRARRVKPRRTSLRSCAPPPRLPRFPRRPRRPRRRRPSLGARSPRRHPRASPPLPRRTRSRRARGRRWTAATASGSRRRWRGFSGSTRGCSESRCGTTSRPRRARRRSGSCSRIVPG